MNWDKALRLVAMVSIVSLLYFLIRPMFPEPDRMGPKALSASKLSRLEACMWRYQTATSDWPSTNLFEAQLRPYLAQESNHPEQLLVDAWGNRVRYIITDDGTNGPQRVLYFFGRNRQDDHRTGDDIVVSLPTLKPESK